MNSEVPKDGEPDNRFYQMPSKDDKLNHQPVAFSREIFCPFCGSKFMVDFFEELGYYREPTGRYEIWVHHCDSLFILKCRTRDKGRDKFEVEWGNSRKPKAASTGAEKVE